MENLIVQLEGEARPLRHAARRGATSLASMSPDFYGRDLEQQLEDAERDIASARQRLAAILADEPP